MCLYPKFIINRKYTVTKKNGGNVPTIKDPRTKYVPVGCGKCMECRKQKARQWSIRLQEHIRNNKNGYFITLSFSDRSLIDLENEINTPQTPPKSGGLNGYDLDNKIATLLS